MADRLFHQISVYNSLESPLKEQNVYPQTSFMFLLERDFQKSICVCSITIDEKVVESIQNLRQNLDTFSPLGPQEMTQDMRRRERMDEMINGILHELSEAHATTVGLLKSSQEKGVIDEGVVAMQMHGAPYSLMEVCNTLCTSMADCKTPFYWERNKKLISSMAKAYSKRVCENAYMLCKKPTEFLPALINIERESVQKIVENTSYERIVSTVGNPEMEIGGVIVLSHQCYRFITTKDKIKDKLKTGIFEDNKPFFSNRRKASLRLMSTNASSYSTRMRLMIV